MARTLWLACVLVACAGLAGCSSSSDNGEKRTEEGLKAAAADSTRAIFDNEARDLYNRYSKECRKDVSFSDFVGTLLVARAFFEGFMGVEFEDLEVGEVEVRNFEGDRGEAKVAWSVKGQPDLDLGGADEFEQWAYEDGKWVLTDCSGMSFDSDGDESDDEDEPEISIGTKTATPDAKPLVVTKSEWWIAGESDDTTYVWWFAEIENPNDDLLGEFASVSATARGADGKVLATSDQTFWAIAPGGTVHFATQLTVTGGQPATVEIEPLEADWRESKAGPSSFPEFTTTGVTSRADSFGYYRVTGEIVNPYAAAVDSVAVTAILRDASGKAIGGGTTYVDTLPAGGRRPFDLGTISKPNGTVATVDVYVTPWSGDVFEDIAEGK
ncbi:MAG: FxLYD domain-containing protein [Hyphomicrobiales bacterium]